MLDGLPSAPSKWIGMRDQIDTLKNLDAPPDIIVNLKVNILVHCSAFAILMVDQLDLDMHRSFEMKIVMLN